MTNQVNPIQEGVTLICCSYNRLEALKMTVPSKLDICGVSEFIFVLDGSTDGSFEYLMRLSQSDKRIKVIERNRGGVQAARNEGIHAATTPWALFIDDDDFCNSDFLEKLSLVAASADADFVGAPWVNAIGSTVSVDELLAHKQPVDVITFRSHPSTTTKSPVLTPFLVSSFLGRVAAMKEVGFDSTFRGNSWREETDFFLRCRDRGFKLSRTPNTHSWTERRFTGGHSRALLRYEFWLAVNEYVFLRRHRRQLRTLTPSWSGVITEWIKTVLPRHVSLMNSALGKLHKSVDSKTETD